MKWEKTERKNLTIHGDDFFVSYLADGREDDDTFATVGNAILAAAGSKERLPVGREETALKHDEGKWMILEGDFRKEYEEALPNGYEACVAVYEKHKADHRSNWSTD